MGVVVKICGMGSREDTNAVAELKPDAMGFVLWPGSKRYVRPEEVADWVRDLPPSILKVGVFVDATPAQVQKDLETAGLDVAQLHGAEDVQPFQASPLRFWKAVRLERDDLASLAAWRVDAFLVDTYSSQSPGGTGRVGDWSAARAFAESSPRPVVLAGGLTPDNVQQAIRVVHPWGVDVSSGVEERPGKKNLQSVRRFIEQCREV